MAGLLAVRSTLYLRALKDIDKGNPNAYHTSRQCPDDGYQQRLPEPAPHIRGRQPAVRDSRVAWEG